MRLLALLAVGCAAAPASTPPPAASPQPPKPSGSTTNELEAREQARRDELAAAHRAKLDEQSTALAATCTKPAPAEQRCQPSCYTPEAADPRAGSKSARPVAIMHTVCERSGAYVIVDELGTGPLQPVRGRAPKPHKKGTWQADVAGAVTAALQPDLARGDTVRVMGDWKTRVHPISRQSLRCGSVAHVASALRRPLDACGSRGAIACEATHDHAAHGINVVHFRLLEARRLQGDGKSSECMQAALEAIAVARGMPRWRQYMSLNTNQWKPAARYRTRFDGVLDEESLFAAAIALGTEAEAVYVACGGTPNPKTTVDHEQSFHGCW
jgi:hypothetical protein